MPISGTLGVPRFLPAVLAPRIHSRVVFVYRVQTCPYSPPDPCTTLRNDSWSFGMRTQSLPAHSSQPRGSPSAAVFAEVPVQPQSTRACRLSIARDFDGINEVMPSLAPPSVKGGVGGPGCVCVCPLGPPRWRTDPVNGHACRALLVLVPGLAHLLVPVPLWWGFCSGIGFIDQYELRFVFWCTVCVPLLFPFCLALCLFWWFVTCEMWFACRHSRPRARPAVPNIHAPATTGPGPKRPSSKDPGPSDPQESHRRAMVQKGRPLRVGMQGEGVQLAPHGFT